MTTIVMGVCLFVAMTRLGRPCRVCVALTPRISGGAWLGDSVLTWLRSVAMLLMARMKEQVTRLVRFMIKGSVRRLLVARLGRLRLILTRSTFPLGPGP